MLVCSSRSCESSYRNSTVQELSVGLTWQKTYVRTRQGYNAIQRDKECERNFYPENVKGRNHVRNLNVNGRIKLKWITLKQDVRMWNVFIWLR
jgi:hypothetical protein